MNRAHLTVFFLLAMLILSAEGGPVGPPGENETCEKYRERIQARVCYLSTLADERPHSPIPLQIEENRGQSDHRYPFLARGTGFFAFLRSDEISVDVGRGVLRAEFIGGRADYLGEGVEAGPGRLNYMTGADPDKWVTNVATFNKVRFRSVYPGIDVVYYERDGLLEHDFMLEPGADPERIRMRFSGADRMQRNAAGDLLFDIGGKSLRWTSPVIYQGKTKVEGNYEIRTGGEIGFRIGAYDRTKPLTIDPVVSLLGYFGRAGAEIGGRSAMDSQGNIYLVGATADALYPSSPGAPAPAGGFSNAIITKLSADAKQMVYSTIIGGAGAELAAGVAVDASGNAFIAGATDSDDFPTTAGALRRTTPGTVLGGDTGNCFVAKLNSSGSALIYSTYLGGSALDGCTAIAVDRDGNAYVTGGSTSSDFPTTPDVFQSRFRLAAGTPGYDAFAAKLNPAGSALSFATFVGGTGTDVGLGIAVDSTGVYVSGVTNSSGTWPVTQGAAKTAYGGQGGNPQFYPVGDGFLFKLKPDASGLLYSTFVGGARDDAAFGVAVDGQGNAYVVGSTLSTDFPVTPNAAQRIWRGSGGEQFLAAGDAFVTKVNPAGTQFVYSTLLGGSVDDRAVSVAVANDGTAWIVGNTLSTDFPVTPDATQPANATVGETGQIRAGDGFVSQISADGSRILFASYLGGKAGDFLTGVSVLAGGAVVVTGTTGSNGLHVSGGPVQSEYFGGPDSFTPMGDLFYARFNEGGAQVVTVAGLVNAASYAGGGVSPGMIVTLAGTGMGPETLAGAAVVNGALATTVAETRVLFDGIPAPIIYVSARQSSVVVPYAVKGSTQMVVEYKGGRSAPLTIPVIATGPALFAANASGTGPGAFLNQDGSVNTATNAAARGSVVILYGTGEGETAPSGQDGRLVGTPLPVPIASVQVTIGDRRADVLYAGGAPGLTPGLFQINVKVPDDVQLGAQPVVVRVGNSESQRGVTVAIR